MKRFILLALAATLSAAAFAEDWQSLYIEGLTASKARHWAVARTDFSKASADRPGDSLSISLPGSVFEQIQWRHGAPYSPNFLAAYCGLKEAIEMPTGDSRSTLLSQVKAEFEGLMERREYCPELFFYLDETYVLTSQTDKRVALGKQYAAVGAKANWKVDTEGIAPEDVEMVAELPALNTGTAEVASSPQTTEGPRVAVSVVAPASNKVQADQVPTVKPDVQPTQSTSDGSLEPNSVEIVEVDPSVAAEHETSIPQTTPSNVTIPTKPVAPIVGTQALKPESHIPVNKTNPSTPVPQAVPTKASKLEVHTTANAIPKTDSATPEGWNPDDMEEVDVQPEGAIALKAVQPTVTLPKPVPVQVSPPNVPAPQTAAATHASAPASNQSPTQTTATPTPQPQTSTSTEPAVQPAKPKPARHHHDQKQTPPVVAPDSAAIVASNTSAGDPVVHNQNGPVAIVKPVSVKALKHPPKTAPVVSAVVPVIDNKFALIIGNAESKMEGGAIPYASDDAQKLRQSLITDGGYQDSNVQVVINATAAQMADSLNALASRVPDKGAVFIYFTGVGTNIDGKDYLAGVDSDASNDSSTMIAKDDVYKAFMVRGARVFAFYQVNRPLQGGEFFGSEVPLVGSISQMQATLPGEGVYAINSGGKQVGLFTEAFTSVLKDIRSNQTPIMDFGWQVFYKLRSGGTGSEGGSSNQSPSLPVLTNMTADARF